MGERAVSDAGREVISVRHLWVAYREHVVLEDVNLSVKELDFIGIVGPNGGGKTTLLKALLGLVSPARGEVRIMGKRAEEARRHVGYVPQLTEFDRDFPISVWDAARMGRLASRGLLQRYTDEDDQAVEGALEKVDMLDQWDRPFGDLSGGQRQRVYVARALATDPSILLLDEPLASVDRRVSSDIYALLERLNHSVTILMVSHDVGAISSHVKSVGCLNRRLFYHGDETLSPEMVELAYQCPVDLIAHGVPHRVFADHGDRGGET
jgi:zinc transport system ATP-binding protein